MFHAMDVVTLYSHGCCVTIVRLGSGHKEWTILFLRRWGGGGEERWAINRKETPAHQKYRSEPREKSI